MKLFDRSSEYGEDARNVLNDFTQPRKGVDCGDHPPITPMKHATRSDFEADTWRVYDYIVRHFMGTLSRDLKYKSTTTKFLIDEEVFTNTSNVLIDAGFTKVMTWQAFGE